MQRKLVDILSPLLVGARGAKPASQQQQQQSASCGLFSPTHAAAASPRSPGRVATAMDISPRPQQQQPAADGTSARAMDVSDGARRVLTGAPACRFSTSAHTHIYLDPFSSRRCRACVRRARRSKKSSADSNMSAASTAPTVQVMPPTITIPTNAPMSPAAAAAARTPGSSSQPHAAVLAQQHSAPAPAHHQGSPATPTHPPGVHSAISAPALLTPQLERLLRAARHCVLPPSPRAEPPPGSPAGTPNQTTLLALSHTLPPRMVRQHWCVDDYVMGEKLYTGYASTVFKAQCKRSGETVVLKIYTLAAVCDLYKYQIYREVRVHASLQHENVVTLHAAFQEGDRIIMVQVSRRRRRGGRRNGTHA